MATAAMPASRPEPRRDQWGRYLVVPPGSTKPTGYTRATTIAKTLDDGGGLIPWKATATVVGALRRPGLLARWQALMAEHADPWYSSPESKDRAKKLVEECATAGGSGDRADLGTALHAIIEQLLRTGVAADLQPDLAADVAAFTAATAQLDFDRDLIEVTVVNDADRIAGTADYLRVNVPGYGWMCGDLKTGTDLKYSWQAIAAQLAIYSNADAIYRQGEAKDGSGDERLPMPELRHDVALVVHLPAGEARCDLYLIDIEAGWRAVQMSVETRAWRIRKNLATPYQITAVAPVSTAVPPESPPTAPAATSLQQAYNDRKAIDDKADALRALSARPAPDEGGEIADGFDDLQARYVALGDKTSPARRWIATLTEQSQAAGVSFHSSGNRTARRYDLIRGLLVLAQADACDDDMLRGLLELVVGDVAQFPSVPPGHVLGSLSAGEARQFADYCNQLVVGHITVALRPDGTYRAAIAA